MDASQIELFEKCPKAWFYAYVQNLEPKHSKNRAINTGSYYHEVLAHYYGLFIIPSKDPLALTEAIISSTPLIGPLYLAPIEDRIRSAIGFATQSSLLQKFGLYKVEDIKFHTQRIFDYLNLHSDEDERTEFIAVEQGFSYILYEDEHKRYIAEGKIDIICRRRSMGLVVQDHKTQSRKDDRFEFNHQVMNYMNFTQADYFEYDYIGLQDKLPPKGLRRMIYKPPEGVIEQWVKDVLRTFDAMYNYLKAVDFRCAEGIGETIEDCGDIFPRRRHSCDSDKYGLCQFYKIDSVPDDSKFLPAIMSHYKEKDERWRAWS